jgi:hydroxyacylglutathione hydrolase
VGGKGDHVPAATMEVEDGQVLELGHLQIRVLQTPCHTRGHVLYFVSAPGEQQPPCLFSGDTLFIAGCGRFFEGSAQDMFTALCVKVARLPDSTLVYCGHEYTVNNLKFAASVEPDNEDVKRKLEWSMAQRQKGLPTIPSTLAEEKRTNPFMRVHELAVVAITNQSGNDPVAVMKELRARKDAFGLGSGPRL